MNKPMYKLFSAEEARSLYSKSHKEISQKQKEWVYENIKDAAKKGYKTLAFYKSQVHCAWDTLHIELQSLGYKINQTTSVVMSDIGGPPSDDSRKIYVTWES